MTEVTWLTPAREALSSAWTQLLASIPTAVGAVALLLIGWLVAKLIRALTIRSITRAGKLLEGRQIDGEIRAAGIDRLAPAAVGAVVFWLVFLLFVAATGEFLGLEVLTVGLNRLAEHLPAILGAFLVLLAGIVVGNLVRTMVAKTAIRARLTYGDILGQGLRWAILLVTSVVALDQVGIDSELLITATNVLIASTVGGVALAFALGSRGAVTDILAMHYVVQTYRLGQRIRIDDLEGEIAEFKKTAVVIDSTAGRVLVPAHEFREKRSVLLDRVDR